MDVGLDCSAGWLDWPETRATDMIATQPVTSSLVVTDFLGVQTRPLARKTTFFYASTPILSRILCILCRAAEYRRFSRQAFMRTRTFSSSMDLTPYEETRHVYIREAVGGPVGSLPASARGGIRSSRYHRDRQGRFWRRASGRDGRGRQSGID